MVCSWGTNGLRPGPALAMSRPMVCRRAALISPDNRSPIILIMGPASGRVCINNYGTVQQQLIQVTYNTKRAPVVNSSTHVSFHIRLQCSIETAVHGNSSVHISAAHLTEVSSHCLNILSTSTGDPCERRKICVVPVGSSLAGCSAAAAFMHVKCSSRHVQTLHWQHEGTKEGQAVHTCS